LVFVANNYEVEEYHYLDYGERPPGSESPSPKTQLGGAS
jgi:hypothetical protein